MAAHGLFRPHSVKNCIFCDINRADSREHAWPQWTLKRLLPAGADIEGTFSHERLNAFSPGQTQVRVRCVCEPCNTGWMKALEDEILPLVERLINDVPSTLSIDAQHLFAAWALKTAMVFDYLGDRRIPVFYSATDRAALRLSRAIHQHTFVWLARNAGVDAGMRGLFADVHSVWLKPQGAAPIRGSVTTLGYKHLLFQITSLDAPRDNRRAVLPAQKMGPWDLSTERVWPRRQLAEWPPILSIDPSLFPTFVDRYKGGSPATPDIAGSEFFPTGKL